MGLQHSERDITLKGHGPLLGVPVHQLEEIHSVYVAPLLHGFGQQADVVELLKVLQVGGLAAANVSLDEHSEGLGALGVFSSLPGTG